MPRPGGSPERSDEAVAERSKAPAETSGDSPGGPTDAAASAPRADARHDPRTVAGELAALADALLEQARALRAQYDQLLELLAEPDDPAGGGEPAPGRPVARMPSGSGASPTAGPAPARGARPRRSGRAEGRPGLAAREPAGEARGDEGAMLVALQMALNGTPREEAAAYLRETFGIEGDDILEEAYGRTPAPQVARTRR